MPLFPHSVLSLPSFLRWPSSRGLSLVLALPFLRADKHGIARERGCSCIGAAAGGPLMQAPAQQRGARSASLDLSLRNFKYI